MFNFIKNFEELDLVAKASMVYILIGFIQKGISLISGPIFTRLLSKEEYGILSAYNSWYELIGVVTMLSLSAGVYNNGLMKFPNDRDRFTFSLLILSNITTIFVMIVGVICGEYTIQFLGIPPNLLIIMFLSYIFSPALLFWTARQRYEYKYKFSCVITLLSTAFSVFISVIVTLYSEESMKLCNKIWSEKGVLLLFWIMFYAYLAYKAKCSVKVGYWKYALSFNLPLVPHYLSNYVLNSIDRLMILNMVGAGEAAIYSVAYSAAFLIQIFWQSINAAILPMTYECIKNKQEYKIQSKVLPFLCLYGILCVIIAFVAPELMLLLAPKSYIEGVYLIPILVIGVFFTGVYCLYANIEFYYESTRCVAANSIFSAMVNIILNYLCIRSFGYQSAAYTTVISYLLQTLLHYRNYKKLSVKIYDGILVVIISSGVIVGCISSITLYDYADVRYAVLLILLIGGILKREEMVNFYYNLKK